MNLNKPKITRVGSRLIIETDDDSVGIKILKDGKEIDNLISKNDFLDPVNFKIDGYSLIITPIENCNEYLVKILNYCEFRTSSIIVNLLDYINDSGTYIISVEGASDRFKSSPFVYSLNFTI